ncbi:MAG: hypothetical protein ACLUEK_07810 [Oscillospiraceae bacterium]
MMISGTLPDLITSAPGICFSTLYEQGYTWRSTSWPPVRPYFITSSTALSWPGTRSPTVTSTACSMTPTA